MDSAAISKCKTTEFQVNSEQSECPKCQPDKQPQLDKATSTKHKRNAKLSTFEAVDISNETVLIIKDSKRGQSRSMPSLGEDIHRILKREHLKHGRIVGNWTGLAYNLPDQRSSLTNPNNMYSNECMPMMNLQMPSLQMPNLQITPQQLPPLLPNLGKIEVPMPSTETYSTVLLSRQSTPECSLQYLMSLVNSCDPSTALNGLAEICHQSPRFVQNTLWECSSIINGKLMELLKHPQFKIARSACQLTACFFVLPTNTRCKEFDIIVNVLLYKTSDANRNMRFEAKAALASLAKHISTLEAIRVLCAFGPSHVNTLVRLATIKLIVEVVIAADVSKFMHLPVHDAARKMVITNLIHFLDNRSKEVRRYAIYLYNILNREGTFHFHALRCMNRSTFNNLMMYLNLLQKMQIA